jgi:hypothetical protein
MAPLQILIYLVCWVLYLLCQSFLMNGIKLSSEGSSEVMPNGKVKLSEMIFAPIAEYLNESSLYKVFYEGKEFKKLIESIAIQFPELRIGGRSTNCINIPDEHATKMWEARRKQVGNIFDVKVEISNSGGMVKFYREYSDYRFSKYIRKPIIGCIICMPSFWTLWTYLVPCIAVFGFNWWTLPLYFVNALQCAYINYKIYKSL